jgi:hypothetical protein
MVLLLHRVAFMRVLVRFLLEYRKHILLVGEPGTRRPLACHFHGFSPASLPL